MDRRTFIKALPALTVLADAVPSIAEEPSHHDLATDRLAEAGERRR